MTGPASRSTRAFISLGRNRSKSEMPWEHLSQGMSESGGYGRRS